MKILQISPSYKPAFVYGGPTMSVSALSEELAKAGCAVEVFTTTANGATELNVNPGKKTLVDGVQVTYFKRLTKDHTHFSPDLFKALWKQIKNFDVVHIHAWWNLVSVFSALIAMMRQVPVLISPRGTLSGYSFRNKNGLSKNLIHNLLGKHLLNNAYLHTTSVAEQQAMDNLLKPKIIAVVPNFVKILPDVFPKVFQSGEVLKLLFFSRIEEKKGLDILLQALPLINIPFHLTIAGDGKTAYIDSLKKMTEENFTADKISWIGFLGDEKFEVLQNHDIFILPSYDENFGNAVIESLSVGTAVLISRQVGLADYVMENQLGWICEVGPLSVSDAINQIASKKDKLMRIGLEAPTIIYKDFNTDILVERYINMYQEIIDNERI